MSVRQGCHTHTNTTRQAGRLIYNIRTRCCIINNSLFIQFVAFAATVSSRMHSTVLAKRKIKACACVCLCVSVCAALISHCQPESMQRINNWSALALSTCSPARHSAALSPSLSHTLFLCCCWKIDASSASGKFIRPVKNNSNFLHIKLQFNVFEMHLCIVYPFVRRIVRGIIN